MALSRGDLVVTANQRAARTLRRMVDGQQRASGADTWAPAPLLAWETWTRSLWRQMVMDGAATSLLLNRTQELSVWRAVIAADQQLRTLRQPEALAALAADAWSTLHTHGHLGPMAGAAESTDEAAFRRWSASFRARCRRDGLLSAAELEGVLARAIAGQRLRLEQGSLVLVGFDQRTPAQEALLDALARSGVAVSEYIAAARAAELLCCSSETSEEELAACAMWLREQLRQRGDARLAVIVPDLGADRAELERLLRDALAPEFHNIEARSTRRPYEFSLGVPLGSTASVAVALDLLTWSQEALPPAAVSRLLLSRYVAGESFRAERLPRAELDAGRTRSRLLRPELTLDGALRQVSAAPVAVPGLRRALGEFRRSAASLVDGTERTYGEWAERMRNALEAAGWVPAGESSLEYQVRERWRGALDELATLDFSGAAVAFSQALEELKRLTAETIFAPEAGDAPVQVLGPLEAAGSGFDAIWLLRCGDLTFPPPAGGNPLLPWRLRRAFRLPGSSAAEDTARARRLIRRILASAPEVVVSYARHLEQGTQRLAAVARELAPAELPMRGLQAAAAASAAVPLVQVIEDVALPPSPDRVLRGGAGLLADQAACGFRAFAQHRLGSKPLEEASFGLDPRERGNVVHEVLEQFWKEVKTQSALRALSMEERRRRLHTHIHAALEKWSAANTGDWDRAYLEVQRSCFGSVLMQWMEEELLREPFEVRSQEKSHAELAVGPLRLSVRVDRIDVTASGGAVVIDYKTGVSAPKQWLTERPDAPQLPLYTLLPEVDRLDAVAFGIVRTGRDLGFAGYEARPEVIPHAAKLPAESLLALQGQWRETLERLAGEFHVGDARVQPKAYPTTCRYCAQRLLCRLDPAALMDASADEPDAEEDAEGA